MTVQILEQQTDGYGISSPPQDKQPNKKRIFFIIIFKRNLSIYVFHLIAKGPRPSLIPFSPSPLMTSYPGLKDKPYTFSRPIPITFINVS